MQKKVLHYTFLPLDAATSQYIFKRKFVAKLFTQLHPLVEVLVADTLQIVFFPTEHMLPLPVVVLPLPVQPPSTSCVGRLLVSRRKRPIGKHLLQFFQEKLLEAAASLRHL